MANWTKKYKQTTPPKEKLQPHPVKEETDARDELLVRENPPIVDPDVSLVPESSTVEETVKVHSDDAAVVEEVKRAIHETAVEPPASQFDFPAFVATQLIGSEIIANISTFNPGPTWGECLRVTTNMGRSFRMFHNGHIETDGGLPAGVHCLVWNGRDWVYVVR